MRKFSTWLFSRPGAISYNISSAIALGVIAFLAEPQWLREWLWFVAGVNVGFALFWLSSEYYQALAREKMKAEMHAIGADIVRRMREHYDTYVPLVPNDREPPQETRH